LVVALSGGADSAVCAWAVRTSGREARAVTVDHGLAASGMLVAAARKIADVLGVEHAVVDGSAGDDEDSLRIARYAALEEACRADETILTAHTADDQAETVLGNVLRGAGAAGVAGIPPGRGRWVRPMLGLGRAEVRELAARLGLPFADDPDNVAAHRRRSRLRTEVIPYLSDRVNPALRAALLRLGAAAAADEDVLADRADRVQLHHERGVVRIPAASLATLPRAISARVARRALRIVFRPYAGRSGDVEAILAVAAGAQGSASLSEGWLALREGPWVVLAGPAPGAPPPADLVVPGATRFGDWTLTAIRADRPPTPRPLGRYRAVVRGDLEGLGIRAAAAGDRIPIPGGSKPAFEALAEAGVPVRLRAVWPALVAGGTMGWLVGARLAPEWRAEATGPVIILEATEAS
jgi:tRNA(Ile)-lysidine synthase